jgi:endoglucanase
MVRAGWHLPVSTLLILVGLLQLPAPSRSQGYLHSAGTYILNGSNIPITLRGMGLGGWLVPEGYMIGTSSFANSPTAFLNTVTALVGDANADLFFAAYRQEYIQRKDIDSLAHWGFNSVRLPMHYGLLSSAPGQYVEAGFAIIDSLLSWCEANSMYLILDMHCAPGGQNSDNISDYQGSPSLWESATYRQWTAEIWKTIAARYATKHWIGGYDLLNETAWSFSSGNGPLRDLFMRITDSIRTVDRNHMIFAEGNWYATDFSGLTPAWDNNMAWSFHKYWNTNDYSAISGYVSLRNSTSRPLWLGESGENSNQWFSDCITMMEQYNIGWSWWTHKKIESISCPLSVKKFPGYDVLLKYWSGQGSKPSVTDAMNALLAQAALLDADSCTFHPDFLNALFGVPAPNQRKPFAANTIPGVLYAVNYDMGKNGAAYADADFQNTQGVGGPAYNSGYTYRNDGVDIERGSDAMGNGYNVGWISANEFLAFTVQVQTGGQYDISARVAASGAGGSLKMLWDGGETPSLTVPSTGGWQNWQTVNLGNYVLDAGSHDYQVWCVTSGYNLSSITFTLIAAGVEGEAKIPQGFSLSQNYPNPFNPTTVMEYAVGGVSGQQSVVSNVRLTIYDLLGREVATLVNEKKPAGNYTVRFDASGLASGVYLYRLTAGLYVETRRMVLMK